MACSNRLTLAVAGSRKTQGIIEDCASARPGERILVLTYTVANQREIASRLSNVLGESAEIDVLGWFSFLIRFFVKPYVPYKFKGRRVLGFNYDAPPRRGVGNHVPEKYFDASGAVLKVHLPQLATLVEEASGGLGARGLARLYDRIYIDEVQDLCGYDLEILKILMKCELPLTMVGDVRQAVMATNAQELMNKRYMFMSIWSWFREQEQAGLLRIEQRCESWRCRPEITAFADSLFDRSWGFQSTISLNSERTAHDGVFLVARSDIAAYVDRYRPLFLRYSKASASGLNYDFMNYKASKGLSSKHVLIYPTEKVARFLQKGAKPEEKAAAELYVAVTRAEQSVGFVLDAPGSCAFDYWKPGAPASAA